MTESEDLKMTRAAFENAVRKVLHAPPPPTSKKAKAKKSRRKKTAK